ncbi:TIGR04283 family arsenosugar biosynthesis glycosyltransferase [uncultured Winogradskyella sp.]|uniref:TIGR04283 family arsenosugar biosynthesis glycosyltransferase n=1 Tax=uncultured Winogradskyella sp. TaxID=395353 RepID=UPI00260DD4AD|nr:TIGR04283 family arsenosugar biosynthesis glycosyltransferase [uncultured Winogradskyella sp.]
MISIIIPVLNEVETIKDLLFHLIDTASLDSVSEIIVVDGGSTDGTQKEVNNFRLPRDPETYFDSAQQASSGLTNQPKVVLLDSPKGRAKQMNLGAKHASAPILYFLHADSFPPQRYDKLIIDEVEKGNNAGCFRLKFDSNHWWLRLASWLTQFSWRACRGGDQSQFITRALFEEIGGFDESYIIYEDNILINELYARKEFVVINKKIKTSARMYKKHGVWKVQYHFWTIYVKKWFGASAEDMLAYYKKHLC